MASTTHGAILLSTANAVGAVLQKKMATPSATYAPAVWAETINLLGKLPERTASGSIAAITDGADRVPLKSWEIEVAPNLSGKSSIICMQTKSANVWDEQWEVGGYNTSTGAKTSATDRIRSKNNIPCKPSISYCVTGGTGGGNVQYWTSSGAFISSEAVSWSLTPKPVITTPNDCYFMTFMSYNNYGNTYNNDIAINYPSTITTYSAYSGTTATVSLGRTVYGGNVDVVNGTGTDNGKKIKLNTLSWSYDDTSYSYGIFLMPNNIADMTGNLKFVCTNYINNGHPRTQLLDGEIGVFNLASSNKRLVIRDDSCTTLEQFLTKIADYDLVYESTTDTPFTFTPITPTPETVEVCNFWADTGDSTVVYRADIDALLSSLSGNRGLMLSSPQLETLSKAETEETEEKKEKEDSPEVLEK